MTFDTTDRPVFVLDHLLREIGSEAIVKDVERTGGVTVADVETAD